MIDLRDRGEVLGHPALEPGLAEVGRYRREELFPARDDRRPEPSELGDPLARPGRGNFPSLLALRREQCFQLCPALDLHVSLPAAPSRAASVYSISRLMSDSQSPSRMNFGTG